MGSEPSLLPSVREPCPCPAPRPERLDSDLQVVRNDIQDVRMDLVRLGSKLDEFQDLRTEARRNTTDLATLNAQFHGLIGTGKWLGGIFLLAAIFGSYGFSSRLAVVETQVKSIDTRLGTVETQVKSIDTRLGTIETQVKSIDTRLGTIETQVKIIDTRLGTVETELKVMKTLLGEIKEAVNRRPAEASAEQDERFRRIARAVVEEANRRPETPKPDPKP